MPDRRHKVSYYVLDRSIKPLRDGDVFAGRALPMKWHSVAPETHFTHYVLVNRGDSVLGDSDACKSSAKDYTDEVLLKTEEILEFGEKEDKMIRNGTHIDQVCEQFGDL